MLFRELSRILTGSATVEIDGLGYAVSHPDAEILIEEYGDREIVEIFGSGCPQEFEPEDLETKGAVVVRLA